MVRPLEWGLMAGSCVKRAAPGSRVQSWLSQNVTPDDVVKTMRHPRAWAAPSASALAGWKVLLLAPAAGVPLAASVPLIGTAGLLGAGVGYGADRATGGRLSNAGAALMRPLTDRLYGVPR